MQYDDGDFTVAQPHGAPVTTRPFYSLKDLSHVVMSQAFIVDRDSYVPLSVGTAHPSISGLFLAEEINDIDAFAGLMEFTRVYINKPANRSDYESFSYNFLPIYRSSGTGVAAVREGGSRNVTSRLQRDYFRIGAGLDYETPSDIPVIPRFAPVYNVPSTAYQAEAWWIGASPLEGIFPPPSIPNEAAFFLLGEIVAEDSEVEQYRGDVWCRTTRYVPVGTLPS